MVTSILPTKQLGVDKDFTVIFTRIKDYKMNTLQITHSIPENNVYFKLDSLPEFSGRINWWKSGDGCDWITGCHGAIVSCALIGPS